MMLNDSLILKSGLRLPNRLVVAPMTFYFDSTRVFGDADFEFLKQNTTDFGTIILGSHSVFHDPTCWSVDDTFITNKSIDNLLSYCHSEGKKVFIQLFEGNSFLNNETINTISQEKFKTLISYFVKASIMAFKKGFDGIEIHSSNSFLLHQMLSRTLNQRRDAFGGSVQNRSRLLHQIVHSVKEAFLLMGKNSFSLGIRITPEDLDGGITSEDYQSILEYSFLHQLDYVHLSLRNWRQVGEDGQKVISQLKKCLPVDVKLITSGLVRDQVTAIKALQVADLVSIASPLINQASDLAYRFPEINDDLQSLSDKNSFYNSHHLGTAPLGLAPMNMTSQTTRKTLSSRQISQLSKIAAATDVMVLGSIEIRQGETLLDDALGLYDKLQMYSFRALNHNIHKVGTLSIAQLYINAVDLDDEKCEFENLLPSLPDIFLHLLKTIDLALEAEFDGIELTFSNFSFWHQLHESDKGRKVMSNLFDCLHNRYPNLLFGIRLSPETFIGNLPLQNVFGNILVLMRSDYVSLNVSHINSLKSMIAIDIFKSLTSQVPILVSGNIRDQMDSNDCYYKGMIPLKGRPFIDALN